MIHLNKVYPFDIQHQFLKRISASKDKPFKYLIGLTETIDKQELTANLKKLDLEIIEVVKIPKYKPLTRKQLEFTKDYWPCNFFEYKQ